MTIAAREGRLVDVGDAELYVVEHGQGLPLLILHGGPGLDHRSFGDYLDPLASDLHLVYVDQRAQGRSSRPPAETWTLERMAADVVALARAMGFSRYAVLGHSYGSFVALQYAIDFPYERGPLVLSGSLPSSRYLERVEENLRAFEPVSLRDQVARSWERERDVQTDEEVRALWHDQLPYQFLDPHDPRMAEYESRSAGAVFAPEVLRAFAQAEYGGIEAEDRLGEIRRPVLVLAGRHDRTCVLEGAESLASGIPGARLVVFEQSAHMAFVEEQDRYLAAVRGFLGAGDATR
jgi:proline-specific peptidase